jgi:hypothetical protein
MPSKTSSVPRLGGWLPVLGIVSSLLAALASSACSEDDGAAAAATLSSCHAYCEVYTAATCPVPNYPDVDACKFTECEDIPVQPRICQGEAKAYFDCRQAQADLCADDGCDTQQQTLLSCN